ncbi:hypothetical protein DL240_17620 [Lujinxingia litoralis]|uniref:Cytochrome c-552/4 domain-containing protein n=1 Tax=Lujinxingia litoralis TaxID=2211119 RepID=A0A328C295_9DELT|nr:multiheme c-type cytochrome [Lujinxingia litoralis]RAL20399.1 hypothetical protein DL240_17620 [Lujinxingia litoralis]
MFSGKAGLRALLLLLALATLALMLYFGPERAPAPEVPDTLSAEEALAAADAFYKSRPIYERPHPYTPIPEGLPDLRAETCGACHAEIYREWQVSTHRRAWLDDVQFMEELSKSRGEHNPPDAEPHDVSWLCVNCHTPLVNQLEKLVVGLENDDISKPIYVENPVFDPELQLDAITCATCHVRDGVVLGPRGDSPAAPHPVAKGDHLMSEENCVRCHQAEALFPEQTLGCFFTTGQEWEGSAFADQGQHCQDCHMPQTERQIVRGYDVPKRTTRHHWFGGSLIPKKPDYEEEIAPLRQIFGSGATLELLPAQAPACSEGPCPRARVVITNSQAGHRFPTGDPERHADVVARVFDARGQELARQEMRIGAIFEWWPEIKIKSDNRLMPGQSHEMALSWPAQDEAVRVELRADKYRMHQEAYDYHELEGKVERGRTFHSSTWEVSPEGQVRLEVVEDDRGRRHTLAPASEPAVPSPAPAE